MKPKTRSLSLNLLIYFLIFSATILCFLYIFQILFLNTYYKMNQSSNLTKVMDSIEDVYNGKENVDFEELSIANDACIEVVTNKNIVYSSNYFKHCLMKDDTQLEEVKNEFEQSGKHGFKATFINENFDNKSLVMGRKVTNNTFVFASTSLEPIDRSIKLLKHQFIYVSIVVLVLSLIISYLFAKRISGPIVGINKYAKKIAKKENDSKLSLKTKIAELKELENTLNETVKELAKADETQREFLANVGHDLKTPLTMIEAYASSAKDLNYNNKEKRERDLNIIIDEADRLNSLVNDILLLTKIQSSVTKPKIELFDIKEFISNILDRFKIYENEGYTFIFKETGSYNIKADKKLIERVIYNLIINAINYTGDDKKIIISFEEKDEFLKINITDTGKGIDKKDKENVWNKYFKTDKKYHRNEIGTGLGLSIVREILVSHNFDYGIDSKKGKGTTFYFICKIEK